MRLYGSLDVSVAPELPALGQSTSINLLQDVPRELVEIADELNTLTANWNPVEIYTADPESREREKQSFFEAFWQGREYHPHFTYSHAATIPIGPASVSALHQLLERVDALPDTSPVVAMQRELVRLRIQDDLALCQMTEGIRRRDDAMIAPAMRRLYRGSDADLVRSAEEMFRSEIVAPPVVQEAELSPEQQQYLYSHMLSATEIKAGFEWALMQYGLLRTAEGGRGYRVVIDDRATAIDVRDRSHLGATVFIPSSRRMCAAEFVALIAHEIEAHARQALNGEQLMPLGHCTRLAEESYYEGLAMGYEDRIWQKFFGLPPGTPLPDFYTFAVALAEEGQSFGHIFRDQLCRQLQMRLRILDAAHLPAIGSLDPSMRDEAMNEAWRVTYRVLRGHTDTSNREGFAMAKDLAYFRGWILDRELREQGKGYLNELAVHSFEGFELLGQMSFSQDDIAIPYQDVASEYLQLLLARRQTA